MSEPDAYSFRRYLEAKRTVDRRARDRRVRDAFRDAIGQFDEPVDVCELGAGTGAMVERVLDWTDERPIRYTAIDSDSAVLAAAVENVTDRAAAAGRLIEQSDGTVTIDDGGAEVHVEFLVADAIEHLVASPQSYDVVIGQAFLDLTAVRATLETVSRSLRAGGVGYFPITFDGMTALRPRVDPDFDERVQRRYHRHMDETTKAGDATGDSEAGRTLLAGTPETGGRIVAAGGSDWVVTPTDGGYPADEAYFLHHVVETIGNALADDEAVDQQRLSSWTRARHAQVEAADLVYVAHQLDVLAQW